MQAVVLFSFSCLVLVVLVVVEVDQLVLFWSSSIDVVCAIVLITTLLSGLGGAVLAGLVES